MPSVLHISRLKELQQKQKENFNKQISFPVSIIINEERKTKNAIVWMEDPVNYHYYITDKKSRKIYLGLKPKDDKPNFNAMYEEYKKYKGDIK